MITPEAQALTEGQRQIIERYASNPTAGHFGVWLMQMLNIIDARDAHIAELELVLKEVAQKTEEELQALQLVQLIIEAHNSNVIKIEKLRTLVKDWAESARGEGFDVWADEMLEALRG